MRLIDVDALPNYKLIGTMAFGSERSPAELRIVLWEDIKSMPTIDAVLVVRCRECDNHSEVDGQHYCKFWRMYCPDDSEFFCKAGQRKQTADG